MTPRDDGFVWIVDPLDGTRNYASGIPFYSLVVALALDGEPVVGVNYDPTRGEMFVAGKGRGPFLNDARLEVSKQDGPRGLDHRPRPQLLRVRRRQRPGCPARDLARHADGADHGLRGARALLCRRGAHRPILPPQPRAVGPGGWPAARPLGRWRRSPTVPARRPRCGATGSSPRTRRSTPSSCAAPRGWPGANRRADRSRTRRLPALSKIHANENSPGSRGRVRMWWSCASTCAGAGVGVCVEGCAPCRAGSARPST